MRKFIDRVTLTGANDLTDPQDLVALSLEHPYVVWGILLSATSMGSSRFPSKEWLQELFRVWDSNADVLQLSGHICGKWVRQMLKTGETIDMLSTIPYQMFNRFQINTHAEKHKSNKNLIEEDMLMPNNVYRDVGYGCGQQYIVQYDDVNTELIDILDNAGYNVSTLFDLSHGAGVLPEDWPKPIDGLYCGYAGGLSPDNVAEQIEKIEPLIPEGTFIWIDAETWVRSDRDRVFNLDLCDQFLENASPYVDR